MRVLVLGASGFYGAQVAEVLEKVDGVEVLRARRRGGDGWLRVDLLDSSTFASFEQADLVVNCADTVGAPADQAMRYCLEHGLTFFEMGADTPTLHRLLQMEMPKDATGRAVVGVGIFPGLSTILAHHACKQVEACSRLEFSVRLSPFSGAGRANCELMAKMLAEPAMRYQQGKRVEGLAVGETIQVPFAEVGDCPAVQVGLPDAELIHYATKVPDVSTFIALQPALMRHNFRFLAWFIAHAGPLRSLMLRFSVWSLLFLRAFLLRKTHTRLYLTAWANRGLPEQAKLSLAIREGQLSTATATAAMVALWKDASLQTPPGIYTTAELFSLEPMLAQMRILGHPTLSLQVL